MSASTQAQPARSKKVKDDAENDIGPWSSHRGNREARHTLSYDTRARVFSACSQRRLQMRNSVRGGRGASNARLDVEEDRDTDEDMDIIESMLALGE